MKKLKKNEFIETEKSYVVALLLQKVSVTNGSPMMENRLITYKFRGTSQDQVLGMAVRLVRADKEFSIWVISNYSIMEI